MDGPTMIDWPRGHHFGGSEMPERLITDRYAVYNDDSCEVLPQLPDGSVHLTIESPPFCGLYHYSSSERDLSNARTYEEFFEHYGFIVREAFRLTPPGRVRCVHCMDVPGDGANLGGDTIDFPGDLIRLHRECGWRFSHRHFIWKEPLAVRNRTMAKALAHKTVVEDSTFCECAAADQLLVFRKPGENKVPVTHPVGLTEYAGEVGIPAEFHKYREWEGKQTENKFSHTIWRRYASAFWYDIRIDRVLPYQDCRQPDDEPHFHPLQLDVIERAVTLYTNPGETVLTAFAGVGSEVYGAVSLGRRGVGCELKPAYYRQMLANLATLDAPAEPKDEQLSILDMLEEGGEVDDTPLYIDPDTDPDL